MFISHNLSLGYPPNYIEDTVQEEVDISARTGKFDPLFLQYCLRILYNMRRAGQFADLPQNVDAQNAGSLNRTGLNCSTLIRNRFADPTVVSRYGMDDEMKTEIGMLHICLLPGADDKNTQHK